MKSNAVKKILHLPNLKELTLGILSSNKIAVSLPSSLNLKHLDLKLKIDPTDMAGILNVLSNSLISLQIYGDQCFWEEVLDILDSGSVTFTNLESPTLSW